MWASNVNLRYLEPSRPCDYFIETIKSFQETKEKNCEYIKNWIGYGYYVMNIATSYSLPVITWTDKGIFKTIVIRNKISVDESTLLSLHDHILTLIYYRSLAIRFIHPLNKKPTSLIITFTTGATLSCCKVWCFDYPFCYGVFFIAFMLKSSILISHIHKCISQHLAVAHPFNKLYIQASKFCF